MGSSSPTRWPHCSWLTSSGLDRPLEDGSSSHLRQHDTRAPPLLVFLTRDFAAGRTTMRLRVRAPVTSRTLALEVTSASSPLPELATRGAVRDGRSPLLKAARAPK